MLPISITGRVSVGAADRSGLDFTSLDEWIPGFHYGMAAEVTW